MNMDEIKTHSLVYLATPYSKYPTGIEMAFRDASALAARMMKDGVSVYSPIAHTHPLAIYGDVDPHDHSIWLPFDAAMMDKSDAIVVAKMPTWENSFGVAHEIKVFKAAGKPIYYLDPDTMAVSDNGS